MARALIGKVIPNFNADVNLVSDGNAPDVDVEVNSSGSNVGLSFSFKNIQSGGSSDNLRRFFVSDLRSVRSGASVDWGYTYDYFLDIIVLGFDDLCSSDTSFPLSVVLVYACQEQGSEDYKYYGNTSLDPFEVSLSEGHGILEIKLPSSPYHGDLDHVEISWVESDETKSQKIYLPTKLNSRIFDFCSGVGYDCAKYFTKDGYASYESGRGNWTLDMNLELRGRRNTGKFLPGFYNPSGGGMENTYSECVQYQAERCGLTSDDFYSAFGDLSSKGVNFRSLYATRDESEGTDTRTNPDYISIHNAYGSETQEDYPQLITFMLNDKVRNEWWITYFIVETVPDQLGEWDWDSWVMKYSDLVECVMTTSVVNSDGVTCYFCKSGTPVMKYSEWCDEFNPYVNKDCILTSDHLSDDFYIGDDGKLHINK